MFFIAYEDSFLKLYVTLLILKRLYIVPGTSLNLFCKILYQVLADFYGE